MAAVQSDAAVAEVDTPGGAGASGWRHVGAMVGCERHVWHSRFGVIVIDVVGQTIHVNGSRVEPAPAAPPAPVAVTPPPPATTIGHTIAAGVAVRRR